MPDKFERDAVEQAYRRNARRAKRVRGINWDRIGIRFAVFVFVGTFAFLLFMHLTGWRP